MFLDAAVVTGQSGAGVQWQELAEHRLAGSRRPQRFDLFPFARISP